MNNVKQNKTVYNFKMATIGGAAATLSHALFLPIEAKAAVKSTILGQDHYMKTFQKMTEENIKNTGKKLNMDLALQNAKRIYPELVKTSKLVSKALSTTFLSVTAALFLAKSSLSIYQNFKEKNIEK